MVRPSCSPMNKPGAEAMWFDPARTKQSPPRERRSGERLCIQLRSGRLFRWEQVDDLENSRYLAIDSVADRPVY